MNRKNPGKLLILLLILFCSQSDQLCDAQEPTAPESFSTRCDMSLTRQYDFLNTESNLIIDKDSTLYPFFEKLKSLYGLNTLSDSLPANVVPILHMGDSHIQADFLTSKVRHAFQRDFGNAGRGLIIPLRLARSNEPKDYAISSPQEWSNSKCVQREQPITPGIGGIALQTNTTPVSFTVKVNTADSIYGDRFNHVTVFHHKDAPGLMEEEQYNTDTHCCEDDHSPDYVTHIPLNELTGQITLSSTLTDPSYNRPIYYGFSLENGYNGVLYHTIGVNGACYIHFAGQDEMIRQSAELKPALIILSMGTNEASTSRFYDDVFYSEIDKLVSKLRAIHPLTPILLTTPVQNYRRVTRKRNRSYMSNPNIEKARNVILKYADEHKLACWDLFQVAGGDGSNSQWHKNGLFSRDRIHFTAEGYELQGTLFYQAFMNNYNLFLKKHVR